MTTRWIEKTRTVTGWVRVRNMVPLDNDKWRTTHDETVEYPTRTTYWEEQREDEE